MKLTIADIVRELNSFAPPMYQEDYDNSGFMIGDASNLATGALLTIDVTEEVIREAVDKNANLIISHHPLIFGGIKKLTGANHVERAVMLAIKEDICIYAGHTNFDSVMGGVNSRIAQKIGLTDTRILRPKKRTLFKLITFVPESHAEKVRQALFDAGAGSIGNYDSCSYNLKGTGTFRGAEGTNPFSGQPGKLEFEEEIRIETIFPVNLRQKVISSLLENHPYEEVAYDIYPLDNMNPLAGSGLTGLLTAPEEELDFLHRLKEIFHCGSIRHTALLGKPVRKVALCGGSGFFLLPDAILWGADVFITGDVRYHEFFDADRKILLADIGHFESEQFTREIFYDNIKEKFPKFAIHFSEVNTNPINYL